ncbi:flagellar assembly protein FliH [Fictibacillus sp. 5RED26]|uniref:flagellar assembly protein FliH n=1 Tax=Fictibacillus sp. 5RED26 TaxID=2745876 RepID=UPI0018CCB007|nr:flagellar assembly protein FliH [Fictibacillus sp. 5RED26]MBH0155881.1 flagellar assembly protein FliH [Fictibacillus sp. 5RED26]
MSKVIKSFHDHKEKAEKNEIVIGIQALSLFNTRNYASLEDEDEETKVIRLKNQAYTLLEEAKSEAASITKEVEEYKAAQIKSLAEEEAAWKLKLESAYEQAKNEGYDAGFQNGLEQGHESWASQLNEVKSFMDTLRNDYHNILSEAEPQIVILAMAAAEKILGKKLQEAPETWIAIVKQLVKEAREFEEIKLYVPPQWFELTQNYREELKNMLQSTATLFIYPDENLSENGAVIEFPFGKIDATLDVQLKEIREKLLEQLEVSDQ